IAKRTDLSARGFRLAGFCRREKKRNYCKQNSRNSRNKKCRTPAVLFRNRTAHEKAERNSERKSEHKNAHRAGAFFGRKKIADKRRRRRCERCFANADADAYREDLSVILGNAGRRRQQAPNKNARRNDMLSRKFIRKPAEGNSDDGVNKRERGREQAERCVAQQKFLAERFGDRADYQPVEKIYKIYREKRY